MAGAGPNRRLSKTWKGPGNTFSAVMAGDRTGEVPAEVGTDVAEAVATVLASGAIGLVTKAL